MTDWEILCTTTGWQMEMDPLPCTRSQRTPFHHVHLGILPCIRHRRLPHGGVQMSPGWPNALCPRGTHPCPLGLCTRRAHDRGAGGYRRSLRSSSSPPPRSACAHWCRGTQKIFTLMAFFFLHTHTCFLKVFSLQSHFSRSRRLSLMLLGHQGIY